MSPKELVKSFYESDLANDETVVPRFFHKQSELHWNSSHGFSHLKYDDIVTFFEGTRQAYNDLRFQFSHLLEEDQFVTSRHTLFATTIESPEEEVMLAHFTAIWEVKDNMLYRCYEISQLADEKALQVNSFSEIKI